MKDRAILHLGEFRLDPVAKVLFRLGEPVHLTRKAVETLLVLAENPGQVLTKEEIMRAVWTDRVVDEANLAQNIAVIRKTLNAEKGTPAYIETFPGRGYRIQGPVTAAAADLPEAPVIEPAAVPAPIVETVAPAKRSLPMPLIVGLSASAVALIALAILWRGRAAPEAQPQFRVTAATRMTGKEYQPAISPDGSGVAFLWAQDGTAPPAVWLKSDGDQPPREFSRSAGYHSSPAWAADGKQLAYLRIARAVTELVVQPQAGGPERVLTRLTPPAYGIDHRVLDWSPDGRWFAVAHSDGPGKPQALFLVSTANGERIPLTTPPPEVLGDVDPRFSPDGKQVSFIRLINRTQQEIFRVPVAGGPAMQLTSFRNRISSHDWMAGGRALGIASDRTGDYRVWQIDLRDGKAMDPVALGVYSEFPIQVSFARSSRSFVYSALRQDRNIWRFDRKESSWVRLIASSGQDASPQYSPKGDRISFRSDRSGEEHLWVANADGSGATQITRGAVRPSVGKWSPDGKAIVFNDPRTDEMYVAESDGKTWALRNLRVRGVHPAFATSGDSIYAGGTAGIFRVPVRGGVAVKISDLRAESLSVSPDGKYIYFARERNDTTVRRLPVGGGEAEVVAEGLVPGCTSCWAVSLEGIIYLGTEAESFDRQVLLFRPFESGVQRMVVPYPEPLWPQGSGPFSLSPDGRYLLTVRVEPSDSDVMLVRPPG